MRTPTSEITGAALDWAVAKCEGRREPEVVNNFAVAWYTWPNTHYSTDWAQGGPIIEREIFHRIVRNLGHGYTVSKKITVITDDDEGIRWVHGAGPTILIAAMRCYVSSKLGDEVEIPVELTTTDNTKAG